MSTVPGPEGAQIPADSPHLRILSQYVKELSFQNPMAAQAARNYDTQPTIDMGVEVKSRPMAEDKSAYEVELRINVQARRGEDTMFLVDLNYGGLFQFQNIAEPDVEPLLWVECPRLLFPFSRQILAEVTREGGYPPLLINPIDFTPLYWAELRDREAKGSDGASNGGAVF
jgi:preprotein translocase subunit SecB